MLMVLVLLLLLLLLLLILLLLVLRLLLQRYVLQDRRLLVRRRLLLLMRMVLELLLWKRLLRSLVLEFDVLDCTSHLAGPHPARRGQGAGQLCLLCVDIDAAPLAVLRRRVWVRRWLRRGRGGTRGSQC